MYEVLKNIGLEFIKISTNKFLNKELLYAKVTDIKKSTKYIRHMQSKGLFTVYFDVAKKLGEEKTFLWTKKYMEETLSYAESIRINKLNRLINENRNN